MRTIDTHKTNAANEALTITVTDEPGAGGANCRYEVTGYSSRSNPSANAEVDLINSTPVLFQNGPIADGINGITQEVLLAIVIDRLASFQFGPYACQENHEALCHCYAALFALKARTKKRLARGVEGTHVV